MPVLEVRNLQKTFVNDGIETPALRGVSFDVGAGEFVAIMGPSGSGKSTLLHILGFLDRPTSGEYFFEDKSFALYSESQIAKLRNQKLGFIFQAFNLLPKTTVLENVKLPLLYSEIPERQWNEKALAAIDSVGLAPRINHESSQLSGGEKQRVAIARALVLNPLVVFADEPTGNLDSKSGSVVMECIKKLHQEGRTIILITHETYTARYAERILRLRDGLLDSEEKVTSIGDPNDFKK